MQASSTHQDSSFLPLLITGVAGVPGFNALRYFRDRYGEQVVGVRRPDHWPLGGPGVVACDLEDPVAVQKLFEDHRFAAVLSCAGSCRLKSCELDPAMAHRVNVITTSNVVFEAARAQARLIHLSIDLVFAGRSGGNYVEDSPTDPVTVYGKTMVQAEQLVRSVHPLSTVLRISLPMGISFNGHAGAVDWIASRFKKGKPATLYYDEVRTPTYVDCMNQLYERILQQRLAGTFHAGGPRRLSLYQIAQVVNYVGGYNPALLKGCYREAAGPIPPRAGDVTLDSSRLHRELGTQPFLPWPADDLLVPDSLDWHHRRSIGHQGSDAQIQRRLYSSLGRAVA